MPATSQASHASHASHAASSMMSSHDKHDSTSTGDKAKAAAAAAVPSISVIKRATIILVLVLSMFLVSLDRTILGVAVPRITDEFHALDDVAWYFSAYSITNASLQLLFGRIYKFNPAKTVFIISVLLFEVGSAVCGAAPNSIALIIGRAIAGSGAAGIFSGVIQIVMALVPLEKRPVFMASMAAVFGVASAVGPLLGGAFTQKVSWRWCFYINLPFAAVALLVVAFFFDGKLTDKNKEKLSFREQINRLDPIGTLLIIPSVTCLLIALQWGGARYSWNDGRIIALLVVFAVTLVAFVASQIWLGDRASLPPKIFTERSVLGTFWYLILLSGSMSTIFYYLPIWFQVVQDKSPLSASYHTLPSILAIVISSIVNGVFTQKVGYYAPGMLVTPILSSVGAGLISTWTPSTSTGQWMGYQILYGVGIGVGMQGGSLAVQAALPPPDVPIGIAATFFAREMGGAIFVAVAQNLLQSKLAKDLSAIPQLHDRASQIAHMGATEIRQSVSGSAVDMVVNAFNASLRDVWYMALACSAAMILPFALVKWINIKKVGKKAAQEKAEEQDEDAGVDKAEAMSKRDGADA